MNIGEIFGIEYIYLLFLKAREDGQIPFCGGVWYRKQHWKISQDNEYNEIQVPHTFVEQWVQSYGNACDRYQEKDGVQFDLQEKYK